MGKCVVAAAVRAVRVCLGTLAASRHRSSRQYWHGYRCSVRPKCRALCQRCRVVCVVRCRLKKKHLSFVLRARSYCLLPVAFQPTEQCQRYHTYLCISGTPMRHSHDEGTATGAGTTTTSSHMTGRRAVVVDGHTTMVLPAVQCFSCEASLLAESSA